MRSTLPIAVFALIAAAFSMQGCETIESLEGERPEAWQPHLKTVESKDLVKYPNRARAYVPVYSHIYTESRDRVLNLAETLSVRNVDDSKPIVITSVKYQSGTGKMVREYVPKPVILEPMATADFVVQLDDTSGGSGASFVVDWSGDKTTHAPLIEAVMVSTGSGRNLSFITRAVELPPAKEVKKEVSSGATDGAEATTTSTSPSATSASPSPGDAAPTPKDN